MDNYGYYGWGWTGFRDIIYQWQQIGMFDVILPLLLIFTVVYAILDKIKVLGENKAVNLIIALVLSFFAISNLYISQFFMVLFSYTGVGVAIILAAIILLGLFAKDKDERWKWIFGLLGIIIFIWVLSRAVSPFGLSFFGPEVGYWISRNVGWLLPLIFIGAVIGIVVLSSSSKEEEKRDRRK